VLKDGERRIRGGHSSSCAFTVAKRHIVNRDFNRFGKAHWKLAVPGSRDLVKELETAVIALAATEGDEPPGIGQKAAGFAAAGTKI
jgi:hypothetical protein